MCPRGHCRKPVGFLLSQQVQLDAGDAPRIGLGKAVGPSTSAGPAPGEKPRARWMRELAKELFGLSVFPNFIIKSLEVVVAIRPPLHAETDQPAWMCPASQRGCKACWGGWFSSLYTFHLSPDVIPSFSSSFTSRHGQEAGAATLGPCCGCPHHPSPYLHQPVPSPGKEVPGCHPGFSKEPPPGPGPTWG